MLRKFVIVAALASIATPAQACHAPRLRGLASRVVSAAKKPVKVVRKAAGRVRGGVRALGCR